MRLLLFRWHEDIVRFLFRRFLHIFIDPHIFNVVSIELCKCLNGLFFLQVFETLYISSVAKLAHEVHATPAALLVRKRFRRERINGQWQPPKSCRLLDITSERHKGIGTVGPKPLSRCAAEC